MQFLASLIFTAFLFVWTFLYSIAFVAMALCVPFPRRAALARVWAAVLLTACSSAGAKVTASTPEVPFGGSKNSGYGRELASFGTQTFTNAKTVWIQ